MQKNREDASNMNKQQTRWPGHPQASARHQAREADGAVHVHVHHGARLAQLALRLLLAMRRSCGRRALELPAETRVNVLGAAVGAACASAARVLAGEGHGVADIVSGMVPVAPGPWSVCVRRASYIHAYILARSLARAVQ